MGAKLMWKWKYERMRQYTRSSTFSSDLLRNTQNSSTSFTLFNGNISSIYAARVFFVGVIGCRSCDGAEDEQGDWSLLPERPKLMLATIVDSENQAGLRVFGIV